MKRGTPDHPKMKRLARALGIPQAHAVGIMEMLWHFTAKYAIQGDIGRHEDWEIADAVGWTDDPSKFVHELVRCGFLDVCAERRLIVHDWSEHCDQSTRKTMANRELEFFQPVSGKVPPDREEVGDQLLARKGYGSGSGKALARRVVRCSKSDAESIYAEYPRKVAKKRALDAIVKAVKSLGERQDIENPVEWLRERVREYAASPRGQPATPDYRPNPATWFNGGNYDDDPAEWQRPNGDNSKPRLAAHQQHINPWANAGAKSA